MILQMQPSQLFPCPSHTSQKLTADFWVFSFVPYLNIQIHIHNEQQTVILSFELCTYTNIDIWQHCKYIFLHFVFSLSVRALRSLCSCSSVAVILLSFLCLVMLANTSTMMWRQKTVFCNVPDTKGFFPTILPLALFVVGLVDST